MLEHYLDQLGDMLHLCADTDGILIVNKQGVIEYHSMPMPAYYTHEDTVGKHILDIYPSLTEETSTILTVLRTGIPSYQKVQRLINDRGQNVTLESTTLPIIVGSNVEGVVDSSHFFEIGHRVVRSGPNGELSTLDSIITENAYMKKLKQRIWDAAQTNSPAIIYGEIGTGKKLAAEALHREGPRANGPFIVQNCAAMHDDDDSFYSESAGDEKNLFELADGGTLFLDEFDCLSHTLQAKLIKALSRNKRHAINAPDAAYDVRVVAAMNDDPYAALREKRLREDLYYKLGVIKLRMPPLREHADDIPLLMRYFIDKYNLEMKRSVHVVSSMVESILRQYSWPGNVQELKNVIEGALVSMRSDTLRINDVREVLLSVSGRGSLPGMLDSTPPANSESFSLNEALENYEKSMILQALQETHSISQAARRLGISRQNLQYRLQKYNI